MKDGCASPTGGFTTLGQFQLEGIWASLLPEKSQVSLKDHFKRKTNEYAVGVYYNNLPHLHHRTA